MIRVNQVKLPVSHSEADLRKKTAKMMEYRQNRYSRWSWCASLWTRAKSQICTIYMH